MGMRVEIDYPESIVTQWNVIPDGHKLVSATVQIKSGRPSVCRLQTHGLKKDGTQSGSINVTLVPIEVNNQWIDHLTALSDTPDWRRVVIFLLAVGEFKHV